jgi:hypothetical protein
MKLLVVRYDRERGSDDAEQAQRFLAGAEKIAGLAGLAWKLWSYDDEARRAENVYLFETEEQARAWGDGPLAPSLESFPGVSAIEIRYYDVDERLSAVTRAPLGASAAV